ncbi:MAG: hypothetical protein KGJ07_00010 [Patescibacteria group bacterium]|nr:hypothetical protein [Patescibacteria group bacterium]
MMSNPQPAVLTEQQKVDCRRHCGLPVYGLGVGTTPPTFGYRYYEWYLIFEYRLNNLSQDEANTLVSVYIATCNTLEQAILGASNNLDTDRAAVWYHNKEEVPDRWKLYKLWCDRLIEFLGVGSPSKLLSPGMRVRV